jgi:peptidoglycan/LPS O-acetylase OafA/YrhL
LQGGFLGVDMFFVISGFLITSLLAEEWSRAGSISLRNFYIRRALRLAPALIAVLLFSGFIALVLGSFSTLGMSPVRLASTIAYFSNWIRAYEAPNDSWFLVHFWSLSIEEQFYLVWPVALLILIKKDRRTVVLFVIGGIAASCLLKAILYTTGSTTMRLYHGSDTRADALLIGCLLSLCLHWNYVPSFVERHRAKLSRAGWALLGLMVVSVWRDSTLLYFGGFTLVSLASALVIMQSVFVPAAVLTHPVLTWIGKRSYGLYLWHWPVYQLAGAFPKVYILPMAVIGTFCFAAFSYRYIESPFLRLRHSYRAGEKRFSIGPFRLRSARSLY